MCKQHIRENSIGFYRLENKNVIRSNCIDYYCLRLTPSSSKSVSVSGGVRLTVYVFIRTTIREFRGAYATPPPPPPPSCLVTRSAKKRRLLGSTRKNALYTPFVNVFNISLYAFPKHACVCMYLLTGYKERIKRDRLRVASRRFVYRYTRTFSGTIVVQ